MAENLAGTAFESSPAFQLQAKPLASPSLVNLGGVKAQIGAGRQFGQAKQIEPVDPVARLLRRQMRLQAGR